MRNQNSPGRSRGYTVIECLTVFLAVAVLLAVAVPAIQQARTQSRNEECVKRLKQLGLAMHNYHDVYLLFPPGWISRRQSGEGHPASGWNAMLLPYLNHAPLYNRMSNHGIYHGNDRSLPKTPIAAYRCTTDSLGPTNPMRGGWGTSNFSGNHGPNPIGRWSGSDYWPGQTPTYHRHSKRVRGIFEVNGRIRIRDITDGTSNTIMIGEKSVISGGGIWPGPRSNFHETDVVSDLSYFSTLNRSETGFSSRHVGGILYFLFCDGAVRPISAVVQSLPPGPGHIHGGILQHLAGRNDGVPISTQGAF